MAKAGSDLKLRTGNNKLFKLVVVERSDCRHDEVAQRNRLVFPAENHECLTNRSQTLAIGRECVGRRRRTLESSLGKRLLDSEQILDAVAHLGLKELALLPGDQQFNHKAVDGLLAGRSVLKRPG
jgi:hypothetical protein